MSQFIYLLNAMEVAAQADNPAEHGYGPKRRAVLEYVAKLEQAAQPEVAPPKERLARITIRNPDLIRRVRIEVCGRLEVLEAGESFDLALAEKDRHPTVSSLTDDAMRLLNASLPQNGSVK